MGGGLRERLAATGAELGGLAARVRALIDATVVAEAPAEALVAAGEAVERAVAALAPYVPPTRPPRYPMGGDLADPGALMPYDPVMGTMSPLAPPIVFSWEDGRAIGRVRFGTPYEGPPGCVHGGVVASAFDQVFNVANVMSGTAGPTVRLALRYRRPTPVREPVVFEGWLERTEGKRVHTRGRLRHGDVVTVEAEGLFIRVPVERVMRLLEHS
jgi:acyl-coenzyme A thioesterase PaaI-like protein